MPKKIPQPTRKQFIDYYSEHSGSATAVFFGVKQCTITNWAKKFSYKKDVNKLLPDRGEFTEYYANHDCSETAKYFNVSKGLVTRWAKIFSFRKQELPKLLLPDLREFVDYYENHSQPDTAVHYGVSVPTIARWARKINYVKIKPAVAKGKLRDCTLSDEQMELVMGSMLGDGTLTRVQSQRNSSFRERHSLLQDGYVKWKQLKLKPFADSVKYGETPARKKTKNGVINDPNRVYRYCQFQTLATKQFTKLEQSWYLRDEFGNYILDEKGWRIKRLPQNFILTPFMLLVWFLDDGENSPQHRRAKINSQSFSEQEVDYLIKQIQQLGYGCSKSHYKHQFCIYIGARYYKHFIEAMQSFNVPDCMKYKTSLLGYVLPRKCEPRRHLTDEQVAQIVCWRYKDNYSLGEIAEKVNMSVEEVSCHLKKHKSYNPIRNHRSKTGGIKKVGNRYHVAVHIDGKSIHLGTCGTEEEAKSMKEEGLKMRNRMKGIN